MAGGEAPPRLTETDTTQLRRTFALATEIRAAGQAPFGAAILAADGTSLAEAGNTTISTGDPTAHAEMVAIRTVATRYGAAALAGATLYASTEPCPMCAAAAYITGIGRVVFGLRAAELARARGGPLTWQPLRLPAAELAARGARPMTVEGPCLEDEAALPHAGLGAA